MLKIKAKEHRKALFYYSRLLHIYISASLFSLLIFFCVTGLFLNHLHTFGGEHADGGSVLPLPKLSAVERDHIYLAAENRGLKKIQDVLQQNFSLRTVESIDFDRQSEEIILHYALPAGYASAIVDLAGGKLVVEYRKGNWLAIINDLHKGRDSGPAWSWIIDLSAVFMILFAITGLILLLMNRKYKRPGLLVVLLGSVSPLLVYFLAVPRLSGI